MNAVSKSRQRPPLDLLQNVLLDGDQLVIVAYATLDDESEDCFPGLPVNAAVISRNVHEVHWHIAELHCLLPLRNRLCAGAGVEPTHCPTVQHPHNALKECALTGANPSDNTDVDPANWRLLVAGHRQPPIADLLQIHCHLVGGPRDLQAAQWSLGHSKSELDVGSATASRSRGVHLLVQKDPFAGQAAHLPRHRVELWSIGSGREGVVSKLHRCCKVERHADRPPLELVFPPVGGVGAVQLLRALRRCCLRIRAADARGRNLIVACEELNPAKVDKLLPGPSSHVGELELHRLVGGHLC
mmetsp:Transcript_11230/g.45686  ORF Transcript_11230/g.45686 Transcript_11230/m.45686 type:complete len:300 (+) Transcript_11230:422-1321(+)